MKYGFLLGVIFVTLIAAIHYNYGSDYSEYFANYKEFIKHNYTLIDIFMGDIDERAGEVGWLFFMYSVRPFGVAGFYVLVAALSIFQGVVVYKLIKHYVPMQWWVLSLFIYLFNTSLYVGSLSGLRQNTAMVIIACSIPLIIDRKVIQSLIIVLVAASIHTSALIMSPFIFWGFISQNRRKLLVLLYVIIVSILYVYKDNIQILLDWFFMFEDFRIYQQYTEQEINVSYGIGFIISLIPVFLSLVLLWKANVNEVVFKIVSLASISYVLMPIVNNVGLASRLTYYFDFISIIALPFCFSIVKSKPIMIAFLFMFVLLYSYSYYTYFFTADRYETTYIYHSLFDLL